MAQWVFACGVGITVKYLRKEFAGKDKSTVKCRTELMSRFSIKRSSIPAGSDIELAFLLCFRCSHR